MKKVKKIKHPRAGKVYKKQPPRDEFEEFLKEEGIFEEVESEANKQAIAYDISGKARPFKGGMRAAI